MRTPTAIFATFLCLITNAQDSISYPPSIHIEITRKAAIPIRRELDRDRATLAVIPTLIEFEKAVCCELQSQENPPMFVSTFSTELGCRNDTLEITYYASLYDCYQLDSHNRFACISSIQFDELEPGKQAINGLSKVRKEKLRSLVRTYSQPAVSYKNEFTIANNCRHRAVMATTFFFVRRFPDNPSY